MTSTASRLTSLDVLRTLLDPGSYRSWDDTPAHRDVDADYAQVLDEATARSGSDEAVRTGEGRIEGHPVAVVCGEFGFLGGSVGSATADRVVTAVERATARGLPLLASTASGGTRMQEGTPAFLRMADITAAVTAHKSAGLAYLVHLRHPTTGGVLASWGSLGHLTVAEPGALIGFLGPKVYAALRGTPFPDGVQTAENLHAHGLVDAVLSTAEVRATAARVLDLLARRPAEPARPAAPDRHVPDDDAPAWTHITTSRRGDRPGVREVLAAADGAVLVGDTGSGVVLALARLGTASCVVVGQDRHAQLLRPIGPDGLRVARRGIRLAGDLRLPLVTMIDTTGADLSPVAEEGGLAREIARCLADLLAVEVPTISVLLGQGTGGGALALLPADRMLATRHAWLAPLPPEGAAAILFGSADRAADAAATQRVSAVDLRAVGAVDRIVDERPDAADEPAAFGRRIVRSVEEELRRLSVEPARRRLDRRRQRLRGR